MSILDRPFATTTEGEVTTYRGKSLDQVLPRIREDLGPDAVVLRQRAGLIGGVGGFFATKFVEVDARAGGASVDVYDEDDETEPPELERPAAGAPEPEEEDTDSALPELEQAWAAEPPALELPEPTFTAELQAAVTAWSEEVEEPVAVVEPEPVAVVEPEPIAVVEPKPAPRLTPRFHPSDEEAVFAVASELVRAGCSPTFADDVVRHAAAHPVLGSGLRANARVELARRIRSAAPLPVSGAAIALVGAGGAGKSLASAALASAYQAGSALLASVVTMADEPAHLAATLAGVNVTADSAHVREDRIGRMIIVDTPAVSPADRGAVSALADDLETLHLDAVYAVVPATLSANAARRVLGGFGALELSGIVISHADEGGDLATLIELADAEGLPVAYVTDGPDHRTALRGADPATLAQSLLP